MDTETIGHGLWVKILKVKQIFLNLKRLCSLFKYQTPLKICLVTCFEEDLCLLGHEFFFLEQGECPRASVHSGYATRSFMWKLTRHLCRRTGKYPQQKSFFIHHFQVVSNPAVTILMNHSKFWLSLWHTYCNLQTLCGLTCNIILLWLLSENCGNPKYFSLVIHLLTVDFDHWSLPC